MHEHHEMPFLSEQGEEHAEKKRRFKELIEKHCHPHGREMIEKNPFVLDVLMKIGQHDKHTLIHSLESGNIAAFVINRMRDSFTEDEKKALLMSGYLHDCGKITIDTEILNKPKEQYTDYDQLKMDNHPRESHGMLNDWNSLVAEISVSHHEHQDRPYPRVQVRFDDAQVERLSRILAIIDSFQAMLDSERPSNNGVPKTITETIEALNTRKNLTSEEREVISILEKYYYCK